MDVGKQAVHDFWNEASCGEDLYLEGGSRQSYEAQAWMRYALEPFIFDLARFPEARGKKVLEIGVGLGADHQLFSEAGADLYGIDLTERAIDHTRRRLSTFGLSSQLATGDAENLTFPDEYFDLVYSWGVIHHSPNTPKAVAEIHRVLKAGGSARVMIYHKWSMVGLMLWFRYALLRLRPWLSLTQIYAQYLESPGTKAYSVSEARSLFAAFSEVRVTTRLGHADLLESQAGQRHRGALLFFARMMWPRWLLKRFFPTLGLFLMVEARK